MEHLKFGSLKPSPRAAPVKHLQLRQRRGGGDVALEALARRIAKLTLQGQLHLTKAPCAHHPKALFGPRYLQSILENVFKRMDVSPDIFRWVASPKFEEISKGNRK